ncbi:MAG TPA: DUF1326 domain-containing protein [Actinomycetota bacterium]|nr:DUF1326 domain-containing protein [Actinomycetota bacterium]
MTVQVEAGYRLQGTVLDAYAGAPFWLDGKAGDAGSVAVTSWLIDDGHVAGIGVSGTPLITVTTKTGAGAARRSRRLLLIDEDAPPEVVRWVVDAFQGRLGGRLADLASLSGEQVGFYQVPINYRLEETRSTIAVPDMLKVVATGRPIPASHPAGSAAPWRSNWIGDGTDLQVEVPDFGMVFRRPRARVVRGSFRFDLP